MIRTTRLLDKDQTYWFCEKCKIFFEARFVRCLFCARELKGVRIKRNTKEEIEEVKYG